MTAPTTLDGTFRLQPPRSTVLTSSSGGGGDGLPRAPGSSSSEDGPRPPKAILLKLTAAAYEQIRALHAAPAGSGSGQLRLEVPAAAAAGYNNSSGGDSPMSLRIGSHSFSLAPRPATAGLRTDLLRRVAPTSPAPRAGSSSSSQRAGDAAAAQPALEYVAQSVQHQYITSLASNAHASSSSSTRKVGASKGAAPTAAAAKRAPAAAGAAAGGAAADVSAAQEKTAANMGERIRERAAQLEKQKEKRKVVVLDDAAGVLPPGAGGGKKGARLGKKGASASSTGPIGAKASPLLRASAASTQRHASPAGSSPRGSPLLGASAGPASRPASRLVASEAAKGLMSRMEKERTEQQAKIAAEKEQKKQTTLSEQAEATATAQQEASTAPASLPSAKREAGSGQTSAAGKVRMASSTSSTSSYSSASASTQASTSTSATSASAHRPLDTQAEEVSFDTPPTQEPKYPPPKQRIDDDDLASASSSDDEMEDVMPLARRVSPTKSDAVALPNAIPAVASTLKSGSRAKVAGAPSAAAPAAARPQKPPTLSSTASSSRASSVSSDERSASSTSEMSTSKRKHDVASTTASATGSSTSSLQVPQPASKKARTSKAKTPEPEPSSIPTAGVQSRVQASPPRGGPRTQGRTSGGTRLSKPLPKRAPGSNAGSKSASPAPTAASLSPAPSAASASPPTDKESGPGKRDVSPGSAASPPTKRATANGGTARSPAEKPSLSLAVPTVAHSPADGTETKLASPLRSPGLSHPSLPAKPIVSPIAASRSPLLLATKISPGPRPTYDGTDTGQSAPPSPVPSARPVVAASTNARDTLAVNARQSPAPSAPAPLPVKPSTVIPPFGQSTGRASESGLKRSASNASLRSKVVDGVVTSAPASRASSPIVSTFAASHSSGAAHGGMANGKSSAPKPEHSQDRRPGPSDTEVSAKRVKKAPASRKVAGSRADIVWTSSEGEEGEAEESAPERPKDARQVAAAAATRTRAGSNARPRTTSDDSSASTSKGDAKKNKDGLPSFSKKSGVAGAKAKKTGRASELLREGTVSRATTPNSSDAPARSFEAQPSQGSPQRGAVIIASDADFHQYSQKFSEELFPAYSRLRHRLGTFQASIANGTADADVPRISARDLQSLVDETNERGQELERIKDAMTKYSRERERAIAREGSVSRGVSVR